MRHEIILSPEAVSRNEPMVDMGSLSIQPNVYYTVEEAAELLRVSPGAVMQLLRSRRALGVKIGREWRILGGILLNLPARGQETERAMVANWLNASLPSLQEVWDNEEDAVYDQL